MIRISLTLRHAVTALYNVLSDKSKYVWQDTTQSYAEMHTSQLFRYQMQQQLYWKYKIPFGRSAASFGDKSSPTRQHCQIYQDYGGSVVEILFNNDYRVSHNSFTGNRWENSFLMNGHWVLYPSRFIVVRACNRRLTETSHNLMWNKS